MRGLVGASILCAFGWTYIGLGFVCFPLSVFLLLRSRIDKNDIKTSMLFWLVFLLSAVGFILSVYLVGDKIAQKALM